MDGGLRVNRSLTIPEAELEWRFSASGGPGGQHANTANTKVEVLYDIEQSGVLGPRQRARLLAQFGAVARAVASDRRSQLQNRELAAARLAAKLADTLRETKVRRPTKPTKASKTARLQAKRRRSQIKQGRRVERGSDVE